MIKIKIIINNKKEKINMNIKNVKNIKTNCFYFYIRNVSWMRNVYSTINILKIHTNMNTKIQKYFR